MRGLKLPFYARCQLHWCLSRIFSVWLKDNLNICFTLTMPLHLLLRFQLAEMFPIVFGSTHSPVDPTRHILVETPSRLDNRVYCIFGEVYFW